MVFFQALLLAGYAYSDWTTRRLSPRAQVILHSLLLAASLAVLPIITGSQWKPTGDEDPGLRILALLSVTIGLPFVMSKYIGPGPTPFAFLPVDACHCWHGGLQDLAATARFNLTNAAVAVTPSISIGVPSHGYVYQGEAVIGRHLVETRFGLDAGSRLDAISSRLSVQAHYSYAMVERVLDLPNNRSNIGFETGILVTRRMSLRGMTMWQRTHGGLRLGSFPPAGIEPPGEVNTIDRILQHDRLLRDNNWRAGLGASYSLPHLDVFASYVDFLSGTDSHDGRVFTTGVSWPFEVSR